jgi:hypothetical protein
MVSATYLSSSWHPCTHGRENTGSSSSTLNICNREFAVWNQLLRLGFTQQWLKREISTRRSSPDCPQAHVMMVPKPSYNFSFHIVTRLLHKDQCCQSRPPSRCLVPVSNGGHPPSSGFPKCPRSKQPAPQLTYCRLSRLTDNRDRERERERERESGEVVRDATY